MQQKNQTCCFVCTEVRGHMPTKGSFILVSVKENKHWSALFYLLCLLTSVYLKLKGFWLNSWITIQHAAFSFNLVYLFEGCSLHFCPLPFKVLCEIPKAQVKPGFFFFFILMEILACSALSGYLLIWSPLYSGIWTLSFWCAIGNTLLHAVYDLSLSSLCSFFYMLVQYQPDDNPIFYLFFLLLWGMECRKTILSSLWMI